MLEVVLSAILGEYLPRRLHHARDAQPVDQTWARPGKFLPLQGVRGPRSAEMSDIDALGAADPDPALQRLMHVPEQHVPRLGLLDGVEQGLAAPLHPAGHGVEQQVGHGGRDVRAEDVDLPDGGHLGGIHIVGQLVRGPVHRAQPAAHETERPAAEFHPLAVEHLMAGPQVLGPHPRDVDVAVGQVRRGRQRGEQLSVLAGRCRLHVRGRVAAEPGPQPRRHLPGLIESLRGAQRDELLGGLRAEQVGKNAVPVVRVVHEQQQVAEADKGVRAVGRALQRVGPAMHITDHVHPHALTLGKSGPEPE